MTDKKTDSGIEVEPLYSDESLSDFDAANRLGKPGEAPYTRGIYPTMHRDRLWTMRQYAGFGTAADTNERFKFLLSAGQTGLSCAFDLPTISRVGPFAPAPAATMTPALWATAAARSKMAFAGSVLPREAHRVARCVATWSARMASPAGRQMARV